jgi:hypothetical protein
MSGKFYRRLVNVLSVIVVIAVLLHDHVGEYAWLTLGVAGICALIGAVAYFRYHWTAPSVSSTETGICADIAPSTVPVPGTQAASRGSQAGSHPLLGGSDALVAYAVGRNVLWSWAPAPFDAVAFGELIAELGRDRWDLSGTVKLSPPAIDDIVLNVIIDGGMVRLIPTVRGHRDSGRKPPLSRPPIWSAAR